MSSVRLVVYMKEEKYVLQREEQLQRSWLGWKSIFVKLGLGCGHVHYSGCVLHVHICEYGNE
jgi:hypothetical protein